MQQLRHWEKHRTKGCRAAAASDKGLERAADPHRAKLRMTPLPADPSSVVPRQPVVGLGGVCPDCAAPAHRVQLGPGSGTHSSLSGDCSAMSLDDDAISIHLCLLSLRPYSDCLFRSMVHV